MSKLYKNIPIIITFGLVMSIGYNIALKTQLNAYEKPQIIGTYITTNDPTLNAEYLVFTREQEFFKYQQFNMQDTGIYEYYNNIATLNGQKKYKLALSGDNIYFFNQDEVVTYTKISDVELFVNVNKYLS